MFMLARRRTVSSVETHSQIFSTSIGGGFQEERESTTGDSIEKLLASIELRPWVLSPHGAQHAEQGELAGVAYASGTRMLLRVESPCCVWSTETGFVVVEYCDEKSIFD